MHDDVSQVLGLESTSLEEAQRESLSRLIAQVPMPFSILLGPEHVFAFVNPATQRLVLDRVLLGKSFREALPEFEGQGFFETMDLVYKTVEPFYAIEIPVYPCRSPHYCWNRARRSGSTGLCTR